MGKEGRVQPPQNRADSVSVSAINDAEVKQARLRAKLEAQGFSPEGIQEVLDDPEAAEDKEDVIDGRSDGGEEGP
jgi:SOS response regulatory protein OraA/RecX